MGERDTRKRNQSKQGNQIVCGPEPPPKFLTPRGLILRGIVFFAAIAGIGYLLWQEFGGR